MTGTTTNTQQNSNANNAAMNKDNSLFTPGKLFEMFILNWKWFVLSLILCLAAGVLYVKHKMPVYQVNADFLVKDDDAKNAKGSADMFNSIVQNGFITSSEGLDNEVRILQSKMLARDAIRKLGLYVNISEPAGLRHRDLYKNPPLSVNVPNPENLDNLRSSIVLKVEKKNGKVSITGSYEMNEDHGGDTYEVNLNGTLPIKLVTKAGTMFINENIRKPLKDGKEYRLTITSPDALAASYVKSMTISPMSKTTTIAHLTFLNTNIGRAKDFITELLNQYNEQANADKNEIAEKTADFINERLEKITSELGATDGQVENFKRNNAMIDIAANSSAALSGQSAMETKLNEANLQIKLLDYLSEYIEDAKNKYQIIPSDIGLADSPATELIRHFNETATKRNHLLVTSNESNPIIKPFTDELDNLSISIHKALEQAKNTAKMQAQNINAQYTKYSGRVGQTPGQERVLTQIGRLQEVRSSLYTILLQKREENLLSLSATANKGRLIDDVEVVGKTAPKTSMILLVALLLGLALPYGILMLLETLKYKVEGHDDLAKLTKLPIIADVITCDEASTNKAGIVVHANSNGTVEEIFRGIRTNINFLLKGDEKVVQFTSSISGEGKTFNATNTAMSFALLKKRVILIGMDIRKPRLGEMFHLQNLSDHGITNLLRKDVVTPEDVDKEIINSGINENFDVLMAGPIPPNPSELLQSATLDEVINILREKYDYVIIDTAPVGLVTDTIIANRVTDITIFITRSDYTPKTEIKDLNALVEENKLKNVSIILNGVDLTKKKYGYQYGYGSYGKYGQIGKRYGYGSYGAGHHYGYGYGNDSDKKK